MQLGMLVFMYWGASLMWLGLIIELVRLLTTDPKGDVKKSIIKFI